MGDTLPLGPLAAALGAPELVGLTATSLLVGPDPVSGIMAARADVRGRRGAQPARIQVPSLLPWFAQVGGLFPRLRVGAFCACFRRPVSCGVESSSALSSSRAAVSITASAASISDFTAAAVRISERSSSAERRRNPSASTCVPSSCD
jgi:hypothetical protein